MSSTDRAAYDGAFAEVQRAIRAGDSYQTNLTLRLGTDWDHGAIDPARYERLLNARGPAFGAYLDLGCHHVLSVSPELSSPAVGPL